MAANWSSETYKLGQIPYKCKLPCLVQVSEGIYSTNEFATMSAGDIIKIDKHTRIPKVAANFAVSNSDSPWGIGIVEFFESEIFVPLNYRGKVKIVDEVKGYNSVEDLVEHSPRYAEVMAPFTVETERTGRLIVPTGTRIEIERVIPGRKQDNQNDPDKAVLKCTLKGKNYTLAIPVDRLGQFQSLPDETEYTLKEVVERYTLPQVVEFLQNDLRKVYAESLEDVEGNVHPFTDTLRLNRVVIQEVLIGHYKPLEVVDAMDESVSTRTLVLLPLDSNMVRELEVNVLHDATEDDYEKLFFLREPMQTVDAIDEMIYVDFAKEKGLVRLKNRSDLPKHSTQKNGCCNSQQTLPPRPPKPDQAVSKTTEQDWYKVPKNIRRGRPNDEQIDCVMSAQSPDSTADTGDTPDQSTHHGNEDKNTLNDLQIEFYTIAIANQRKESTLLMEQKELCKLQKVAFQKMIDSIDVLMNKCQGGAHMD